MERLPGLDDRCGRFFRYRDFVECSQTWQRDGVENVPQSARTYEAFESLCVEVLDPVAENFGPPVLTYGFSSAALARKVEKGIAPNLDQHASYEANTRGKRICSRDGAAADFHVVGRSSLGVAKWIAQNTRFDRLYFWSADRPIHVSVSPDPVKQLVMLKALPETGHPIPQVVNLEKFLALPDG